MILQFKKTAFAIGLVCLSSLLIISCHKSDDGPQTDNRPYTISGNATGSQVVPSVPDSGSATITGTYNPSTNILNYTSNWTNLTGSPATAGIYLGAAGTSGVIVGSAWTVSGTGTGTTTSNVTLTDLEEAQLLAGNLYYTYSTAVHPTGEVRGQISATR